MVASYSLHHIRTARAKRSFYRRCYHALRRGGVLISGDCAPASTPSGFERDLDLWFTHLGRTFGSRARGRRVYESWADEDVYLPLAEEIRLLKRAGFDVDIPTRVITFSFRRSRTLRPSSNQGIPAGSAPTRQPCAATEPGKRLDVDLSVRS